MKVQKPGMAEVPPSVTKPTTLRRWYFMSNGLMEYFLPANMIQDIATKSQCHNMHLRFSNSLDAAIKIGKYEGISHLYTGLSVTLWMAIPATVLYFGTYDMLRNRLLEMTEQMAVADSSEATNNASGNPKHQPFAFHKGTLSAWAPLIAGISARTFAVCVVSPLESYFFFFFFCVASKKKNVTQFFLLRFFVEVESSKNFDFKKKKKKEGKNQTLQNAKYIYARTISRNLSVYEGTLLNIQAEGFLSLWKGVVPTLWRDVPFSGIYWMGYELLKDHFYEQLATRHRTSHSRQTDSLEYIPTTGDIFRVGFMSGAISGSIASIITQPFDVLKTKRQSMLIGIGTNVENKPQPKDISFKTSLQTVLKTAGPKGLYAGITARLAKVPLACAIMISVYEAGKLLLNRLNEE
ncbi:hypothetical protein RFI_02873 [Reticulomyxa filosa]|uniref:Mitochondrial carrier protein n=1 Tax=Reticulomyxa filosa TaxID=46433 RepID=X6P7Q3_RETFI|nr:hypothetical protein RFI_02873 [Reticulomyxa filosa]|eukprot:ETO34221.1 hypothetical protein RFI_02873 [Reticulomyxa filosa]